MMTRLYSATEAAEFFGIKPKTVHNWVFANYVRSQYPRKRNLGSWKQMTFAQLHEIGFMAQIRRDLGVTLDNAAWSYAAFLTHAGITNFDDVTIENTNLAEIDYFVFGGSPEDTGYDAAVLRGGTMRMIWDTSYGCTAHIVFNYRRFRENLVLWAM